MCFIDAATIDTGHFRLTIALSRNLPEAQDNVRAGFLGAPLGRMFASRTVCLYGLGSIAKALARRLPAFGVRLVGITRKSDRALRAIYK